MISEPMISNKKILKYCFSVSFEGFFISLVIGMTIFYFSRMFNMIALMSILVSLIFLYIITVLNSYRHLIRNIPMSGTEKVYVGQVYNNPLLSKPFIIIKSDHEIVELTKNIDVPDLNNLIEGITPSKIHGITLGKYKGQIFEVR